MVCDKAKYTYNPFHSTAISHSSRFIKCKLHFFRNNKYFCLDGGYIIRQNPRGYSPHVKSSGDVVSALGLNAVNMTTLK